MKGRTPALAAAVAAGLMIQFGASGSAAKPAPRCMGKAATKVGTAQADTIRGTKEQDVIVAKGGDDLVEGRGGNDLICGGAGFDSIYGQGGRDKLAGGGATDFLDGGFGDNVIDGGPAGDWAYYGASSVGVEADLAEEEATGEGTDRFISIEALWGSGFDDVLNGGDNDDTIFGGSGDDTIDARAGFDYVAGDDGEDELNGGSTGLIDFDVAYYRFATAAVDVDLATGTATSEAGNDELIDIEGAWGSDHDDTLRGTAQKNAFAGSLGDDLIDGRDNFDAVVYWASPAGIEADLGSGTATGEGTDTMENIEGISGSPFGDDELLGDENDNYLDGFGGNDSMMGLEGDDWLSGGAGDDQMDGGPGSFDLAEFYETSPVTANLASGTASGEGADTLAGIEALFGTLQGDHLIGDANPNFFFGSGGDDLIEGGDGDDGLDGGDGINELLGQGGIDNCVGSPGSDCEDNAAPTPHILYIDVLAASSLRRNF
ncbi:MAG: calcium-binding protein [Actinomycetota bacterium]